MSTEKATRKHKDLKDIKDSKDVTKLMFEEGLPEKAKRGGGSHVAATGHEAKTPKEPHVEQKPQKESHKSGSAQAEEKIKESSEAEKQQTKVRGDDDTEEKEGHEQGEGKPPLGENHDEDQAQHSYPMEAIKTAEEKYEKAKEAGSAAIHDMKECVVHGLGAASSYIAGKGVEKGQQVYSYTTEKAQKGLEVTKEAAIDVGKTGKEVAVQKAGEAKDVVVSSGESAAHYVSEKAVEVKDSAIDAATTAVSYAGELAVEAKDKALDAGKGAVSLAGGLAVEAKDKALIVGKGVVSYAGEVAVEAKDLALEAGKHVLGFGGQSSEEAKEATGTPSSSVMLSLDSIKKERDYYLAKLREIEILCKSPNVESLPVVMAIQRILSSTGEDVSGIEDAQAIVSGHRQHVELSSHVVKRTAEDKSTVNVQKRKVIITHDVDVAAETNLSPRQRSSDALDVHSSEL